MNHGVQLDKLFYSNEMKHYEKLESRLSFIRSCMDEVDLESVNETDLQTAEADINNYYCRMVHLNMINKETSSKLEVMKEDLRMLEETDSFVNSVSSDTHLIQLDFITGVIDRKKKFLMKRVLHEAMRRNLVVKTRDIEDMHKVIFIVFTHGTDAIGKLKKIFVSLGGRILDSNRYVEPKKNLLALTSVISQIESVEEHNREAMNKEIERINKRFATWNYFLNKEMKIYSTMNKMTFDSGKDCLIGECWIRKHDLYPLKCLAEKAENSGWGFAYESLDLKDDLPPSSFTINKYTEVFQNLTNVYGVPRYGEINPALFTIFLFPMLFGVMFGDIFHGLILMGLSIWFMKDYENLCKKAKFMKMLFDGRYIMFLCSCTSIFFGFLYSDFANIPFNFFDSRLGESFNPIPFGIDPGWHHSPNSMVFINNVKMKFSIIVGFFHMSLGIGISICNALYHQNKLELYSSIIPQTIGFTAFLGYLVFLIIYKWLVTFDHPSLISTLVSMFTNPLKIENEMYPGQLYVQLGLLSLLLVSIPWMFFSKPVYLISRNKVKKDEMMDLWMEQFIHTIEFCIGLISNSSSYLRLWAVSLAHSQLTSVIHQQTIGREAPLILRLVLFIPYIIFTFMLLIGLEGLGSCLHALRLNWIEFHSKFFKGDGYLFEPLNFKVINEDD
ncbi:Vacuolar ATP synthase subunit a [Nosema bombycis CQ1]|uniref:V-type proton ATPase subunit a n=1 Tax=Nosema bombycis (strain CQ1 / CVCC 102059) TaxID=578461 RepID=R0M495_NOSB1|nr:Vacuolar ATP synthase subunit a [Nosema bombycis CQ1]|eukprot:EOB12819.1 Vacuolar ATP synthase subunit a [Nosema bombycis CQ1]